GPRPRPVVPIALPPAAFSRAWSRAMWYGMISGVAGLIFSRERTSMPLASSSSISLRSAAGLSTTPLPIRHSASGRRMPEGIRCSTVLRPPMTRVWPALWPPWKRTTAPISSVSRSTILPLPSSPHCAPSTTTDWPMAMTPLLRAAIGAAGLVGSGTKCMWAGSIGEPAATPGQTRKKPVGRLSPTGFYALSGFWGGGASLRVRVRPNLCRSGFSRDRSDVVAWNPCSRLKPLLQGSAADEVQRQQAAGQDDGADAAQAVFGQGLQLLGCALP